MPVTHHLHPTSRGGAFVAKYSAGGGLVYASDFGGGGALGIAVDGAGRAHVTGGVGAREDFPVTAGAAQVTPGDPCTPGSGVCGDAFVAKLDAAGETLLYSTYVGGNGEDLALGIALDGAGNAYVTGHTTSTDFPTSPGALQPALGGGTCSFGRPCGDAFLTKLDTTGSARLYSTHLGGSAVDFGAGVALDGSGLVYLVGSTSSTDFPTASPIQAALASRSCETAECFDLFVAKLDVERSRLVYATYLGGTGVEQAGGIAVDGAGAAYVTGMTESRDFPTAAAMQPSNAGQFPLWMEGFVAKIADTAPGSVPPSFDDDDRADVAIFRPTTGEWFISRSTDGGLTTAAFGAPGDVPVPGKYDKDAKPDLALFRPATGQWFIWQSSDGFSFAITFGEQGDRAVPADYDGDGRVDLAVYRPATAQWFVFGSTAVFTGAVTFGAPGLDVPVPADFDGDGKADLAVYRLTTGEWFIFSSATGFGGPVAFGAPALGDVPVPADFDGDGKADLAVYRLTTGNGSSSARRRDLGGRSRSEPPRWAICRSPRTTTGTGRATWRSIGARRGNGSSWARRWDSPGRSRWLASFRRRAGAPAHRVPVEAPGASDRAGLSSG